MAVFNLDFYDEKNDDVYTDGSIEKEMYDYVKTGTYDWYNDGRWPIVYHMSHLRENILNWYPFKKNAEILEVGAGCGALTGMLCSLAEKVVAVELTKQRAAINYERNKELGNLEIVVADFKKIPTDWKFDYIVINGVLEYAAYMIDSNNPYTEFLKILSDHLKEDGRILLAIENRLGIKYLSGAKEDHTGKFFSGINDYTDNEKVRTFSKNEIEQIISNANLNILKFYYPYPDYKFPTEIYTDYSINEKIPSVKDISMDALRVKIYNESILYQSLMNENIMSIFSNSFLIEISKDSNNSINDYGYVKISSNRKKQFRICTIVDQEKQKVYKKNLNSEGKKHIRNMFDFGGSEINGIKNILPTRENELFCYNYLNLESLENRLIKYAHEGNQSKFEQELSNLRDQLYNCNEPYIWEIDNEFIDVFGESECLQKLRWSKNANVDLIASNIFIKKDKEYCIIDYEWHLPCEVPMEFVLWRMINQFIAENNLMNFCSVSEQLNIVGISESIFECFKNWDNHFIMDYVGFQELTKLEKDILSIDMEQTVNRILKESIIKTTLFMDFGNGYNENQIITNKANYIGDRLIACFRSKDFSKTKQLRWDPIEGESVIIKINYIKSDGENIVIKPINAEKEIGKLEYKFFGFDPQFVIEGSFDHMTFIELGYQCEVIDWTEGFLKMEKELIVSIEDNNRLIKDNARLNEEIKKFNKMNSEVNSLHSRGRKLLTNLNILKKK